MKQRIVRLNGLCLWLCLISPAAGQAGSASADSDAVGKRPNIVFLMDDQHRWDALGFVNPAVKTPHLDALARDGVFFDQLVCQAPMCIPSRNSLMLGLYPNQTGIVRNGGGLPDEQLPQPTLAAVLRAAGYQTAGFGKAHWGLPRPSTRGFEVRYVAECFEEGARDDEGCGAGGQGSIRCREPHDGRRRGE